MNKMKWLWWVALICQLGLAGDQGDGDGFAPLFPKDGSPQNWLVRRWNDVSKPADAGVKWLVKDGILHGSPSRGTWLISENQYSDFILTYEFKLGPTGNSGCALRCPLFGDPAFDGMELQMADYRYNTRATASELTGGIYRAIAPRTQVYQPTQWNRYVIHLQGASLRVHLNDQLIHDVNLDNEKKTVPRHDRTLAPAIKDRPRRGHIGFQELSRGRERVQIRNARIKVLDSPSQAKPK